MIKKYIGTGFVALGLLFSVSLAAPAQAASLTSVQVQAVIALLQSFGVDAGTIANVQATLGGSSSSPSCSTFANLTYGNFDTDPGGRVSQLQTWLGIPSNTFGFGTYGPRTRALWNSKCSGTQTTLPTTYTAPTNTQATPNTTTNTTPVSTQRVTEQVKCIFNGATTEQKCWGDVSLFSTTGEREPAHYGCSGVGACVVSVSGPKGVPQITWGSSCGGSANTTLDGNNEDANFSCSTITVLSPNGGEMVTLGKTIPITWKTSQPGVGSVSIYLKDEDNGKEFVLEDNTPNNGYYEAKTDAVSVPGIIADRAYRVSIWWDTTTNYAQNRNANDVSDSYFKIYSPTNQ